MVNNRDTIVAVATANGAGGVGVVRVSGQAAKSLAFLLTGVKAKPRYAHYAKAKSRVGKVLDEGVLIYFAAPSSYTGEDVFEFQGHGNHIVLNRLVSEIIALKPNETRIAEPGEFTQRAFINDKLDLAQAEAVADLIGSKTEAAADAAIRSLRGEFSDKIQKLSKRVIDLRVYVEAALDFSEEEVDFMSEGDIANKTSVLVDDLTLLIGGANQGVLLNDGLNLAIIGAPNAGKSSLLNRLAGVDKAIVTEYAGTTRDVISTSIQISGFPVNVIDTAGIRKAVDEVEKIGIKKAIEVSHRADVVIWLRDINDLSDKLPEGIDINNIIEVHNKVDLSQNCNNDAISISALSGQGIGMLKQAVAKKITKNIKTESVFSARARHVDSLKSALKFIEHSASLSSKGSMPELVAEELKYAQIALGEIVGEFTTDDLLGRIFSDFCIGK